MKGLEHSTTIIPLHIMLLIFQYDCGHLCTAVCHSGPCPNPDSCKKKVQIKSKLSQIHSFFKCLTSTRLRFHVSVKQEKQTQHVIVPEPVLRSLAMQPVLLNEIKPAWWPKRSNENNVNLKRKRIDSSYWSMKRNSESANIRSVNKASSRKVKESEHRY